MASIQTQIISFYAIFLSILLTTILFCKVNSIETTSFSIDKFSSNQPNLIFQAGAYASNKKLILTEAKLIRESVGRALYYAPIQIWDSKTGDVVNFQTNFTFVINAPYIYNVADGLAFFIAPVDTKLARDGGYLGVFNSTDYNETAQTVAVEFDTFANEWDPNYTHIGIDVNSIKSDRFEFWNFQNGEEANVVIAFNATTNELSVAVTYPKNSDTTFLSDVVPLKDIVPEWVRVGFSASTAAGYYRGAHEVLSWSFRSELTDTSSSKQVADA